jgi:hypothetical protein
LLRSAGFREALPGRRGFLVEGDPNGGWVAVRCHFGLGLPWQRKRSERDLHRYRDILSAAGFTVKSSPLVAGGLRATLPPDTEI